MREILPAREEISANSLPQDKGKIFFYQTLKFSKPATVTIFTVNYK